MVGTILELMSCLWFNIHDRFVVPCNIKVVFIELHDIDIAGSNLGRYNINEWKINHMPDKIWEKLTYPFPHLCGCTILVLEWLRNNISWSPCYASSCYFACLIKSFIPVILDMLSSFSVLDKHIQHPSILWTIRQDTNQLLAVII